MGGGGGHGAGAGVDALLPMRYTPQSLQSSFDSNWRACAQFHLRACV